MLLNRQIIIICFNDPLKKHSITSLHPSNASCIYALQTGCKTELICEQSPFPFCLFCNPCKPLLVCETCFICEHQLDCVCVCRQHFPGNTVQLHPSHQDHTRNCQLQCRSPDGECLTNTPVHLNTRPTCTS